jgi:hypothetical protein
MSNRNRRTRLSSSAAKSPRSREPKDWRDASSGSGRRKSRGRRSPFAKWLLLCLTLLVLATLLAFWYEIAIRKYYAVPLLVFAALDYDPPLPPNAWAGEDAERLENAWHDSSRSGIRVIRETRRGWASGEEFLDSVRRGLERVKPGGPGRNVVLLYLSAHGVLDDKDNPVLLLGRFEQHTDTKPPIGMLPPHVKVSTLLDELAESRPDDAKVVLFLDAGKIRSNWQLGILYNQFAERLTEVVDKAEETHLVVVNSASPGQVAWCLPGKGGSAFGLAVCNALKGYADTGRADGKITLRELRDYLQQEVRSKSADFQEPLFLRDNEDFPLAFADKVRDVPSSGVTVVPVAARRQLDQWWQIHHGLSPWNAERGEHLLPRRDWFRFEAFQQGLLRLEELLLAGPYYAEEAAKLQERIKRLAAHLARPSQVPNGPTAPSLPLALRLSGERRDAVRNVVSTHWLKSDAEPKPLSDVAPDELAGIVLELLLDESDGIPDGRIDRALGLVQDRIGPDSERSLLELVEMRSLRGFRSEGYLPEPDAGQSRILRTAIRTRRDAELAASATREILALDASRVLTDRGDQYRRQAEDQLFVGGYGPAAGLLDQANRRYPQARQAESALHHVLATRDRIWMEVPYLMQWAAGGTDQQGSQKHHVQTCIGLLRDAEALDRKLYERIARWRSEGRAWTESELDSELDELHRQISGDWLVRSEQAAERLKGLRDALDKELERAVELTEGVEALTRIRNLLRTPLVTGDNRRRLLDLQNTIRNRLPSGSSTDTAFWLKYPEFSHPAALLVERSPELRDDSPATVRENLRQLYQRLAPAGSGPSVAREEKDPWPVRCAAARDASAAVSLFALAGVEDPDDLLCDPLGRLEDYYQAEFWCWQAQRFMEDFYGDEDPSGGEHPPYFARMAKTCLTRAASYYPLPSVQAAGELLKQRIDAAVEWKSGSWIGITAEDGSSPAAVPKVPLQRLDENRGVIQPTLRCQIPGDLPAGVAAVFLEDPLRRVRLDRKPSTVSSEDLPRVLEFPVPATPSTSESPPLPLISPVPDAGALGSRSEWTFGLFYRGHVARRPFHVEDPQVGQVVQVRRPDKTIPQVQVVWESNPRAVAFCLDCSNSMEDRMEGAQKTLRKLLEELEAYPDFSVSLWLFGHRRYLSGSKEPYRLTWNPVWEDYTGQSNDPTVTFENDVQLVWKRNADWLGNVPTLKNVVGLPSWRDWLVADKPIIQHFGFTPLHLVMQTAISEHLGGADPQSTRRLIVLSDGMHDVGKRPRPVRFDPPWAYDEKKDRTAEDVGTILSALNRSALQPIQVLVIADVNDPGERVRLRRTIDTIQTLAGKESCRFETFAFGADAVRWRVRESLGLYLWSVFSERDARVPESEGLGRNAVFQFPQASPRSSRRSIRLHYGDRQEMLADAELAVEGDEAFRLEVKQDDDELRLVHQRYRRGGELDEKRASALVDNKSGAPPDADFNPKAFFVAAHPPLEPLREGAARRFPISIQNADEERFSPRPVEIWAEITPLRRQDGTTEPVRRPFVFYDPVWEPKRPVPVLLLEADPWPPEADAADVRVWFRLEDSPFVEETLSKIRGDREGDFRWQLDEHQVEFAVTYRSFQEENRRVCEVVVLEHLLSDSGDTPERPGPGTRFKVQLSEPAAEIQREFFPELGRVRHKFRYLNTDETSVGAYRLRVTPVAAIRKDAAKFQIPQPLPVPR